MISKIFSKAWNISRTGTHAVHQIVTDTGTRQIWFDLRLRCPSFSKREQRLPRRDNQKCVNAIFNSTSRHCFSTNAEPDDKILPPVPSPGQLREDAFGATRHALGLESNSVIHKKEQTFVDKLRLQAKGGDGGAGCVSFWKSPAKGKFTPADGGNGGRGGDVIVQATAGIKSLRSINTMYKAQGGGHGQKQRRTGMRGKDKVVKVPVGTMVYRVQLPQLQEWDLVDDEVNRTADNLPKFPGWDSLAAEISESDGLSSDEQEKISLMADLVKEGHSIIVAHGGSGGRGNASFRSPPNRPASHESELGEPGEVTNLLLEVKVLADIGLVGLPNAGKSTLLRALSAARPQVASFPFTTLRPHLGTIHYEDGSSLVVADIPGLIRGAQENKGLGHDFLRHIERTCALAYIIDLSGGSELTLECLSPVDQLQLLQAELKAYTEELLRRPAIIVANKVDLLENPDLCIARLKEATSLPIVPVSGLAGQGISDLKILLRGLSSSDRLLHSNQQRY
eukprot:jgi/Botrbrau1/245/Bobra.0022s0219.2